jgi:adenylate cyclase, class 2
MMPQEIEAKFLNVNIDEVRASLKVAGAELEKPMRLMKRVLFDYPDKRFQDGGNSKRLRVRDEGDKTTITYKQHGENKYAHELETTIGSFDGMVSILKAIGLEVFTYQESKRETWRLDNVEVVIDEWPWLNPYIEIEGPDEQSIQIVAKKLGFEWSYAKFGSTDTAYRYQYEGMKQTDSIGDLPDIKFDMPLPQYLKDRMRA